MNSKTTNPILDRAIFTFGLPSVFALSFSNLIIEVLQPAKARWGQHYIEALLVVIPGLVLLLGIRLLLKGHHNLLKVFWALFLLYVLSSGLGDILNFSFSLRNGAAQMPVPSLADVFYWSGYIFLIAGCLFLAFKFRRLRVPSKITIILSVWSLASIFLLLVFYDFAGRRQDLSWTEKCSYLSYPLVDALLMGLAISLMRIYRSARLTHFWLWILCGIIATCVGDILFGFQRIAAFPLGSIANSFFAMSYALYALAVMAASRLDPSLAGLPEDLSLGSEKFTLDQHLRVLMAGNSIRVATVILFIVGFLGFEKLLEHQAGHWLSHAIGAPLSAATSFILILSCRAGLRTFETRLDAFRHYAAAFRECVLSDAEESVEDAAILEGARRALHISMDEAREIEHRLLLEKFGSQFAWEEVLRDREMRHVTATNWAAWRNRAIRAIREKELELLDRQTALNVRQERVELTSCAPVLMAHGEDRNSEPTPGP